jgi:hypothetical protein
MHALQSAPMEEDAEYFIFPREGDGNTYSLNWALNEYAVTPTGHAWGNLSAAKLLAKATGTTSACRTCSISHFLSRAFVADENKALVLSLPAEAEQYDVYVVDAAPDSGAKRISLEDYRRLSYHLRRTYLSEAERLFLHDGAVGNNRQLSNTIRIIADNPAHCLFARYVANRVTAGVLDRCLANQSHYASHGTASRSR